MTDDDVANDELVVRATMGIEAARFLNGKVGQYMKDRAELERADLVNQLLDADPDNVSQCRKIRNEICRIDTFYEYLEELVNSGYAAEQQIEEQAAYESDNPDY